MVERLRTLLHDEAAELLVPAPDARSILREGRRLRRRRPVGASLVAAAAVVAVVGGGFALLPDRDSGPEVHRTFAGSADEAYLRWGAFSVGSTVYVGNHKVEFDQKIKAMYYTSEGVLVRMGAVAETDAGGPSTYVLVAPDGSSRGIPLEMGDRVPGTDPDSPYVAFADPNGKTRSVRRCFGSADNPDEETSCRMVDEPVSFDLVTVDLRTGEVAHKASYDGLFTWGGWEAPPVTTHGDRMWALYDAGWVEYDWATGATRLLRDTKGDPLEAAGGVYSGRDEQRYDPKTGEPQSFPMTFHDFLTGEVVGTVPVKGGWGFLSPDGRVVMDRDMTVAEGVSCTVEEKGAPEVCTTPTSDPTDLPENRGARTRLVTLATGATTTLDGFQWGWTPQGDVISVDADTDTLTRCDSGTGRCEERHLDIPAGNTKVGGLSYES